MFRVRWPVRADGEVREEVFENATVLEMSMVGVGLLGWQVKVPGTIHKVLAEPGMMTSETPEVDPRDREPDGSGKLSLVGKTGSA